MSLSLLTLLRLASVSLLAMTATSCIHLRPVDREFKTAAEFAYDGTFDSAGDTTAEEALKRVPKDPKFEKLNFNRPLDRSLLQSPGGPYRVGPGDELEIEVAELANTRAKTKVMPDGMLYYDVAKGINVKGKTIREISTLLSKALENDYVDPIVTVNVAKADSQRFWMLGQVQKPGTYPITKPTTLISALSDGGGLLSSPEANEVSNPDAADLERSILIRNGSLIPVNFESLVREGDMSQNVYVRGGDYIFVPSLTKRSFYVLGAVNRPGPVYFERNATVLSAVAASGGPLPALIANGTITPQTRVWSAGLANWATAHEVMPTLFSGAPTAAASGPPVVSQSAPPVGQRSHEIDFEIFGDDIQIVEVELDPGETVIAEAGAMNYMEDDITFVAKMGDGSNPSEGVMGKLLAVGKRALTGESIFMTHFTHSGSSRKRRVAFAAPFPGKIIPINLSELGGEITCQKDSFLCAAHGTRVTIAFNRKLGAGFFGGEGFILQKLTGDGQVFVHAGGTIIERELKGEKLRVDTGCIVAFSPGIEYNIERAGNLKSMFFGGEGLFLATLSGHGRVWLQSLPFSRLADRIIRSAPSTGGKSKGEGSVLGGIGRLFDGN